MNIFHAVTGPLSVNTWGIPLDSGRIMIVDPGGAPEQIIAYLEEHDCRHLIILCTHGHLDHILAIPALVRRFPDSDIVIHHLDSGFLGADALDRHRSLFSSIGAIPFFEQYMEPLPAATILVNDGDAIADSAWQVMHTPGHSMGSICLYNKEENILVSGDTLFNGGFGRTDLSGGNWNDLEESLGRLRTLPGETTVLPGHGAQTRIRNEF